MYKVTISIEHKITTNNKSGEISTNRGNGENTPFAEQSRKKERDNGHDTHFDLNYIPYRSLRGHTG